MTGTDFQNRSVLVIEDESFTRMVLVKMLGNLGFRAVHQAPDGEAGLREVAEQRPDAVVCDVEMTPLDGLGFLRALRASADPVQQALPVVFLTNRIDPAVVAEAKALGADTFIVKPATPDTLRVHLAERLG